MQGAFATLLVHMGTTWVQDLEEDDPSVLEPFQKMLQFALEPLLLYVDPIADQPGEVCCCSLPCGCSSVMMSCFYPLRLPGSHVVHRPADVHR